MIAGPSLGGALFKSTANTGTKHIADAVVYQNYDMASLGTDSLISIATEVPTPKVINAFK